MLQDASHALSQIILAYSSKVCVNQFATTELQHVDVLKHNFTELTFPVASVRRTVFFLTCIINHCPDMQLDDRRYRKMSQDTTAGRKTTNR